MSPETKEEILYDANAVQRVPFSISEDEGIEPVVLVFNPISDDRYSDFDIATSMKIVDDGKNMVASSAQASGKLWDELVTGVENVDFEDTESGALPTNWKDAFDLLQFKIPSLNHYLAVAVYEKPKANNGKFSVSISNERVIYADLFFNGKIVTTTHYLQKSNYEFAKQLEQTQKIPIQTKAKGLQESGDFTIPTSAKGKAAVYDKMKSKEAEGFAENVVPIRVKSKIIDFIARAQIQQKK